MQTARRILLTVALLLALVAAAAPAPAAGAAAAGASNAVLEHVLGKIEAGAGYHDLTSRERTVLDAHVLVADEVVQVVDVRAAPSPTGGDASAATTICVIGRVVYAAVAAAGNTLYTYFVEGTWCTDGVTVQSAQHEWSGGEASGPGWTYHGVLGSGGGVSANEGRAWSQHRFTLDFAGFTLQTNEPCVRMRGTAQATLNHDGVCGLN